MVYGGIGRLKASRVSSVLKVGEDVMGPNGDVCGMINFDQFLPLEEYRAAVMIVVCDNRPSFCDGTCDVALKQEETDVMYLYGRGEDV